MRVKEEERTGREEGEQEEQEWKERTREIACMNGELLFAGLLSWPVGPSFVYSVRLLQLLVPSAPRPFSSRRFLLVLPGPP